MEQDQANPACPKCRTSLTPSEAHCPACGLELATGAEGRGPFRFAFPEVEAAYRPSGQQTAAALALMSGAGLVAGVAIGAILPYAQEVLGTVFAYLTQALSSENSLWGLMAMLLYVIAGGVLGLGAGALAAWAVDKGAMLGKGRNPATARAVALLATGVLCVAYVVIRQARFGGDAFDSGTDVLKAAVMLLGTVLGGFVYGGTWISSRPYCEHCDTFMTRRTWERIPIRYEAAVLAALSARDFPGLREPLAQLNSGEPNFCRLTAWTCDSCRSAGLVELQTFQVRWEIKNDGTKSQKEASRRVFSALLKQPQEAGFFCAPQLAGPGGQAVAAHDPAGPGQQRAGRARKEPGRSAGWRWMRLLFRGLLAICCALIGVGYLAHGGVVAGVLGLSLALLIACPRRLLRRLPLFRSANRWVAAGTWSFALLAFAVALALTPTSHSQRPEAAATQPSASRAATTLPAHSTPTVSLPVAASATGTGATATRVPGPPPPFKVGEIQLQVVFAGIGKEFQGRVPDGHSPEDDVLAVEVKLLSGSQDAVARMAVAASDEKDNRRERGRSLVREGHVMWLFSVPAGGRSYLLHLPDGGSVDLGRPAPLPTPTATVAPAPESTMSPTPKPTMPPTLAAVPTSTASPTATPAPQPVVEFLAPAQPRSGPGPEHPPLEGQIAAGEKLQALGRNKACTWLEVPGTPRGQVWIPNDPSLVRITAPCEDLPREVVAPQTGPIPPLAWGVIDAPSAMWESSVLVKNGTDGDAVIVLVNRSSGQKRAAYIATGRSYQINLGSCEGSYEVYYSKGEGWDDQALQFERPTSQRKFEETLDCQAGSAIAWELTLYGVTGGSASTQDVPPEEFPAAK